MTDTSVANTNFVFHVDRNLLTEFIAALHVFHDSFILLSVLPENNQFRARPFGNRNSYRNLIEPLSLIPP